jgi:uncharacterized protein (DUF885 family)
MNNNILILALIVISISCKTGKTDQSIADNKELSILLENYYNERMQLFPLEATTIGDNRFNNLLPADFTESYRKRLIGFFNSYLIPLNTFDSEQLNDNDKISLDILKYEVVMRLESLIHFYTFTNYMPFDQFNGTPLVLGQMGGSTGIQPFKTLAD